MHFLEPDDVESATGPGWLLTYLDKEDITSDWSIGNVALQRNRDRVDLPWTVFNTSLKIRVLGLDACPAAPNRSATPGVDEVALHWTDPEDSTITEYQVRWKVKDSDDSTYTSWADIPDSAPGGTNAAGFTVTGLTNGTAYTFAVRAVNGEGDGPASAVDAIPVPVPAPENFSAAPGDRRVVLKWDDPNNSTITGY